MKMRGDVTLVHEREKNPQTGPEEEAVHFLNDRQELFHFRDQRSLCKISGKYFDPFFH